MTSGTPSAPDTAQITRELLGPVAPPSVQQVRAVAISSLNGSLSLDGVSGSLGNALDQAVLAELRHWADAILVTAHTAKVEEYGLPQCPPKVAQLRNTRGQSAQPQLVLLTRNVEKYLSLPLIAAHATDIVFLSPTDADVLASLEVLDTLGARVLLYDANRPASIIETLHNAGFNRISCEGGPSLYQHLLTHRLLDLLHLTIAPIISSPVSHSLTPAEDAWQQGLTLEHVFSDSDGLLFTRYRVS